jgi:5'-nucleotidase
MAFDLSRLLVVAVSSRALLDLEWEARMYDRLGPDAFREHQIASEDEIIPPGTAYPFIRGLLALNGIGTERVIEVIVISRNNPETGLRITNSIEAHGLDISRVAFLGPEPLVPYLDAYQVDLFLSCNDADVQQAIDAGYAAAALYRPPNVSPGEMKELRIAFDADAVLFSDESEHIYRTQGLPAFLEHERANANKKLAEGPLGRLLQKLGELQSSRSPEQTPIRLAVVSARNSPAHARVIKTLRAWGVRVDSAFFLGGIGKAEILRAFGAHIFFDDQEAHLAPASSHIPCALVPYRSDSALRRVAEAPPPGHS